MPTDRHKISKEDEYQKFTQKINKDSHNHISVDYGCLFLSHRHYIIDNLKATHAFFRVA